MFSVSKPRIHCGFGQTSEIQPGSVPENLSVEWRLTIDEGNRKPQLFRIELTRGSNVCDKELGFGGKKCRFGQSFSVYVIHSVNSFKERLPILESCLFRNQLLRVRQLEGVGEHSLVGQMTETWQQGSNLRRNRIITITMPMQIELRLLFKVFEIGHRAPR